MINDFQFYIKSLIVDYFNSHAEKTDSYHISAEEVYIVWFCKTLQNWKALVSTDVSDGMYYEVTHNGDKDETYLDAYKKFDNVKIVDLLFSLPKPLPFQGSYPHTPKSI